MYWKLLAPIDNSPSSLLNESPRLAQKKSVGYHPIMKRKQAIIDPHCCCAQGGGARQSPHPDGRGSHRTPSRLKVTPCARTFAGTFGTKPIDFWHVFTHDGDTAVAPERSRRTSDSVQGVHIHHDTSRCCHNISTAFAKLSPN